MITFISIERQRLKAVNFAQMIFDKISSPKVKIISLLDVLLKKGNARSGNYGHAGRPGIGVGGSAAGTSGKGGVGIWRDVKVTSKQVRVKNKKGVPVIDPATGKVKMKTVYKFTQMNGKPLPKYMDGWSWKPNMINPVYLEVKNPADLKKVKFLGKGDVVGVLANKTQMAIFKNPDGTKNTKTEADYKKSVILDKVFDQVYDMNERNRVSKHEDLRERADLAKLIMTSGIRVGGNEERNAAMRSVTSKRIGEEVFGASTLLGRHVVIEKGSVYLRFPAKSGERYDHKITSKEVEKMILDRAKKAGKEGNLFNQEFVGNQKILGYMKTLHKSKPTNKIFRELVANRIAQKVIAKKLKENPNLPQSTKKEIKRAQIEVQLEVGKAIGHQTKQPIYKTRYDKEKGKEVFVTVENKKTKKMEKVKTGKFEIKINTGTSKKSYINPALLAQLGEIG